MFIALLIPLLALAPIQAGPSLRTLLSSLDPHSLAQHMAFYELYPETKEGQEALACAWKLLRHNQESSPEHLDLPKIELDAIVALVTRQASDPSVELTNEQLQLIDRLSAHFFNRKLKGSQVWTREEVLALPNEEIDLSRGLLIEQFDGNISAIRQYEASLDLIALQVAARLSLDASAEEKIRAINQFVFQEMHFRFPPHSLYAKDIDLYTFLPSVLDSRQGVCLGVSILYLSIAQRLNLPLEIITPPGHIYLRHNVQGKHLNIETTARGINPPDETYLGINTRSLQERTIKEVIGMAFINQASVYWGRQEYDKTIQLYEKALPYLPQDPLLKLFLGLNYLFVGKKQQGRALLEPLRQFTFDYAVSPETLPDDYLNGRIDIEGLKSIFLPVDEKRDSILEKQQSLHKVLKRFPQFRAGLLQLAVTYLQLGRLGEAYEVLQKYRSIDANDPTVAYYLTAIGLERLDYRSAWEHLEQAQLLTSARSHFPRSLKELRHELRALSPRA